MTILTVDRSVAGAFATIHDAVSAASPGDTINVQAGTYTDDFTTIRTSITLQAINGEVLMRETHQPPDGKALITEGGGGLSIAINGFDIAGVSVPDNNGAAIRYEGGALSLSNDYIHDNQDGLLGAADPSGSSSIDNSEFAFNGDGSGSTHNIYVGAINLFSLTDSYIRDASVGHEVKSRAANNTITNNRILDNNGTASYSVDLPNGGNADISGNVIEQGAATQNPFIIAYAEEGQSNPGQNVSIANNTIVNDQVGNPNDAVVLTDANFPLPFANNSLFGLDAAHLSSSHVGATLAASGDVLLNARPILDVSQMAFINPAPGGGTITPPPPTPDPVPVPPRRIAHKKNHLRIRVLRILRHVPWFRRQRTWTPFSISSRRSSTPAITRLSMNSPRCCSSLWRRPCVARKAVSTSPTSPRPIGRNWPTSSICPPPPRRATTPSAGCSGYSIPNRWKPRCIVSRWPCAEVSALVRPRAPSRWMANGCVAATNAVAPACRR
jgi:hypothetical protein